MKKHYFSILLSIFLGLHLFSFNIFAQTCTQLGLPEQAIARFCIPEHPDKLYGRPFALDFSPDGTTFASVVDWYGPHHLILWSIENKTAKLTINKVNGRYVKYSSDGKTLVCGDTLYNAVTGEPQLLLLDGEGYRDYVVYSPDGKTVVGAGPKGIRFWKSNTEESTTDALSEDDTPINVLFTDPTAVVTSNDSPTSIPIATSTITVPGIRGISYSPDGKELAVACDLGIWIYNVELNIENTLLTREIGGHQATVVSVVYSPNGNTLVSAGTDNTIRSWDARTKKHKFTFSVPKSPDGSLSELISIVFSSKNDLLMSAHVGGQIHLWNVMTGEYKYTFNEHRRGLRQAIFSPDGNIIASPNWDNRTILLWDFTSLSNC